MKNHRRPEFTQLVTQCAKSVSLSAVVTLPMVMLGRDALGEAVIAMLYLLPVVWSSGRWGRLPGLCGALTAALAFDFFFIPPFYTFAVGRLEGWLVLAIFLATSIYVVERVRVPLSMARTSQRDATLMYELGMALAGLRSQDAVVHALAKSLQQMFLAALVEVVTWPDSRSPATVVKTPAGAAPSGKPDRIVPIIAAPGLVGEIHLWRGDGWLPPEDSRLLRDIAAQASIALERARLAEAEAGNHVPAPVMKG
jgi:K+-sensing histidine kinase KdpD